MEKEKFVEAKERLKSFLKTKGLKSTRQRDIIVTDFLNTEGHVTAEELYRRINRRHKNIGFTTVYRTLKLLAESGLATERVFADNLTRYELLTEEEHHDHLICIKCGSITEFEDSRLENRQIRIADELGFQVISHKMEFYGYCIMCREQKTGSRD